MSRSDRRAERAASRSVRFAVEHGRLVRTVERAGKEPYVHRCDVKTLAAAVLMIEERGEAGMALPELQEALPHLSCTQLAVALDFLQERGCVKKDGRRSYAASPFVAEDALLEFHALAAGR